MPNLRPTRLLARSLAPSQRLILLPQNRIPAPRHASTTTEERFVQANGSSPSLMARDPNRPLPTLQSLSGARKWLRTIPIFILTITISALALFNYQKTNSPVVSAILYSLRTTPEVRERLGSEVYFASKWAWISGQLNLVQGRIDVRFSVKGTRQTGAVRFRAHREGGRNGRFQTDEWTLRLDDGSIMDLLSEGDPLEGAAL